MCSIANNVFGKFQHVISVTNCIIKNEERELGGRARDESGCHFELECGDLHILCTHGDMERRVERLLTISQSRLFFMFFYYLVQSIVGGRCTHTQNASNKAEAGWKMRTQEL